MTEGLPRLYAVVDHEIAAQSGWQVCDLARAYLAGGARLLQLRAPGVASGQYLEWCDEIIGDAAIVDARLIVNDRADIAALAGAAGVHLGQSDLAPDTIRQIVPSPMLVGLSTHTPSQLDASTTLPLDYVAVGPVYRTSTKNTGFLPVGLDLVAYGSRLQPTRPVVAIGGITLECAEAVLEAGAASVAVISDLLNGSDPVRRVADYVRVLGSLSAK